MINYGQVFHIRVERAKWEMERLSTGFAKFDNKDVDDACDGEIEGIMITAGALISELEKVVSALKKYSE